MNVNRITTVTTTLELTQEEAEWLQNALKKPIGGLDHLKEAREDATLRTRFLSALTEHEPSNITRVA